MKLANPLVVSKIKKQKKKKSGKKRPNGDESKSNGIHDEPLEERGDAEDEDYGSKTSTEPPNSPQKTEADQIQVLSNGHSGNKLEEVGRSEKTVPDNNDGPGEGLLGPREASAAADFAMEDSKSSTSEMHTDYQALLAEKHSLQEELAQVRSAMEGVQKKHEEDLESLREHLTVTRTEKDQAEAQYRGLLGKVSTIRSQLGERLKADAVGAIRSYCISYYLQTN